MIFFNSSMPRAGSTLMQNILGQNPDIHVTPTDGFLELVYGARVNFTNNAEFKAQDQDQMLNAWRGFCLEGMKGYVAGLSDKTNTCIKSRGIGAYYNWFQAFMGEEPKVICMVRNVKSVLASMEKMHRANFENAQSIENPSAMTGVTTESRVEQWLQGPPVGLALQRFSQMDKEGVNSKCLFIRYEDLTRSPASSMERVYKYLDLPEYEHNFKEVQQITQEDDVVYGMTPDLHKVSPVVEYREPDYKEILGVQLCKWIDQTCQGYQEVNNYV